MGRDDRARTIHAYFRPLIEWVSRYYTTHRHRCCAGAEYLRESIVWEIVDCTTGHVAKTIHGCLGPADSRAFYVLAISSVQRN